MSLVIDVVMMVMVMLYTVLMLRAIMMLGSAVMRARVVTHMAVMRMIVHMVVRFMMIIGARLAVFRHRCNLCGGRGGIGNGLNVGPAMHFAL